MTNSGAKVTKEHTGCVAEIGILIYPECQLSAVHGLTDLFWIASEWTGAVPRRRVGVSHWSRDVSDADKRLHCVWSSDGRTPDNLDYVIIPPSIVMPDKMQAMPDEAEWVRGLHSSGTRICSVCAGAFVLGETGLLDGRRATTHWAFAQQLAARFPQIDIADAYMIIDDGDIITAGGILAWTDLGLTLVERFMGPSAMLATARFLLVNPPRRSQRPFRQFLPRLDHGDAAILRAQHHLHAMPEDPHSLSALAKIAGLTDRTFMRRFTIATGHKPTEYVQNVRVAKAREFLEQTTRPVDQIAWEVGYSDPAAFRKVFAKLTGLAPKEYRQCFGVAS